ncbi:MAG TPA: tRNA (N6-threonylcarbamoyladenosine(37)-N6)-methyltransferase TrmO [Geobacteraceae bacterium]|nr:tRNA (N6-threonylcarbamoyladenosine(37)-N6)-methyltransferase TrmO [Geobacteraceae bacterium]
MRYEVKTVGVIHTGHVTKEETPIQGAYQPDAMGMVELFPEFAAGLKDIGLFSHIILIYHFDRAGQVELIRKPFLDDAPHGIFATRHPCRPNGIGISIVRLLGHEENLLKVGGIDVLDGTPLLDIKPYVPRFDCYPEASEGWFAGKEKREKPPGRE